MASKRLKIGLVLDDGLDKPDGVQQYMLAIGGWLISQGHEVHYLVGETKRHDIPNIHSLSRNIHVRFNGNRMFIPLLASRHKLRTFLAGQQFDVLHVQVPYHPFMAHQLIKAAGPQTAIVGTFHIAPNSGVVTTATKALGLWLHASLKRFDTMLAVSQPAADFCKQTFGVAATVLPNVFDYQLFNQAQPLARFNDNTLTVLFFGRLVPRKGCQLLLTAIKLLQSDTSLPTYRVVICGSGALKDRLQAYVQAHNLSHIVIFEGFIAEADKPAYYASADIAVFPSNGGESFGIVLLEAMASGRAAVLAGDNPGYRSVMHPQPNLLFDPKDVTLLADKLKKYLTNLTVRQSAAEWGALYTESFDTPVVGKKLEQIYFQALQSRSEKSI